jgi:hypothetical protein
MQVHLSRVRMSLEFWSGEESAPAGTHSSFSFSFSVSVSVSLSLFWTGQLNPNQNGQGIRIKFGIVMISIFKCYIFLKFYNQTRKDGSNFLKDYVIIVAYNNL